MPGNLIHHVVQKRNAGLESREARAIQIDTDPDAGLGSVALYLGGAGSHAEDSEKSDGAPSYNAEMILLSATRKMGLETPHSSVQHASKICRTAIIKDPTGFKTLGASSTRP